MNIPLSDFGFVYEMDGKSFSFIVTASSREDAEKKLAAMSGADCVGKMLVSEARVEPQCDSHLVHNQQPEPITR